jgi:serine/threonine-protein kinase
MSPEQAMGKADVDQRTDVFALAAILYEMLTTKVAFEAPTLARILVRIMQEDPTPPSQVEKSAPKALDGVVDHGLAKDKTQRYGGARELANAVISALGLQGDAERLAKASEADIEKELEAAKAKRAEAAKPAPAPAAVPAAVPAKEPQAAPATSADTSVRSADRVTQPTGARPSSLPPLPRTGLGGKGLGLVAAGVVLACIVVAMLMR